MTSTSGESATPAKKKARHENIDYKYHASDQQLTVTFAAELFSGETSKQITLQKPTGSASQLWLSFVQEYIGTIRQNWQTPEDASKWYTEVSKDFRQFDRLFRGLWLSATENNKPRFWRIKPSRQKVNTHKWPGSTNGGSGLFCTVQGKHYMYFGSPPLSEETATEPPEGSGEQMYGIGPYESKCTKRTWYVPSKMSLRTGLIHWGYKVQHEETINNPTHKLEFDDETLKYFLLPLRTAKVDEEFKYSYNENMIPAFLLQTMIAEPLQLLLLQCLRKQKGTFGYASAIKEDFDTDEMDKFCDLDLKEKPVKKILRILIFLWCKMVPFELFDSIILSKPLRLFVNAVQRGTAKVHMLF